MSEPFPRENLVRAEAGGLELREEGTSPVLAGHFAVFDEWTEVNSAWEGHFLEKIAPGAFRKTIKENASRMKVLFNHGKDALGNQALGKISSLKETDRGASYEVELFEGVPPLVMSGLRAGEYGSSFRFSIVKEDYNSKPEKSDYNPDRLPERVVQEAKVSEFGPVTFPAYASADAGVRSMTDEFVLPKNLLERLAGTGAAALSPEEPEADSTPDEDESRRTQPEEAIEETKEVEPEWRLRR